MKKTLLKLLTLVLAVCSVLTLITACNNTSVLSHVEFKTLSLEETNVFSNETIEFSFNDEIERFGYSTFEVSKDTNGENCYLSSPA